MFGVFRIGFPWHEKSPYPWSSVKITITFGFAEDWANKGAAVSRRKSRRDGVGMFSYAITLGATLQPFPRVPVSPPLLLILILIHTKKVEGVDGRALNDELFVVARGVEDVDWWSVYRPRPTPTTASLYCDIVAR